MKSEKSISKHRIINNKIGFYIVTILCTIIVSLGVSTKCNAAVSDLAYIRSNTTSWENEYKQYFEKTTMSGLVNIILITKKDIQMSIGR